MNKTLLAFTLLFSAQLVHADESSSKAIGSGPLHVECTDASGAKTVYNVNLVGFNGNSRKSLFVNGFCSGAGCEGVEEVSGNCDITLNPDFVK